MPLSKRLRFEIFKRDGFTCQYCGRRTPDVVLEVDHIVPRAEDGGDESENLITACVDCNRGKSRHLLDQVVPRRDMAEQAALIRDREDQLREYNAAKAAERTRVQTQIEEARDYWFEVWDAEELERWRIPWDNALAVAVERLGVEDVKEAMDRTRSKFRYPTTNATRYFGGIVRRKIAEMEGRVVKCRYCRQSIVLDPGEDTSLEWWHKACEPDG